MTLELTTLALQGLFTVLLCYSIYLERKLQKDRRRLIETIVAVEGVATQCRKLTNDTLTHLNGKMSKALLQSRMAEKLAERAYQLGSQASVTMASIATTLQRRPLPLSREDQLKNEQIQKKLREMFGEEQATFMEPLLSDKDLEILETVTDPKFKETH